MTEFKKRSYIKFPKNCLFCKHCYATTDLGEYTLMSICDKQKYVETPLIKWKDDIKIPVLNRHKRYKHYGFIYISRNCKYFKRDLSRIHKIKEIAKTEKISLVMASCKYAWSIEI